MRNIIEQLPRLRLASRVTRFTKLYLYGPWNKFSSSNSVSVVSVGSYLLDFNNNSQDTTIGIISTKSMQKMMGEIGCQNNQTRDDNHMKVPTSNKIGSWMYQCHIVILHLYIEYDFNEDFHK